ncbi:cyclic lactone autoinducer peptide [Mobilisporobacter senegalensis]|uniref:Cyclic lactone autoinducer peptide n=1 Tax=Mobilisporobacter senegalensis TaxID=1329262 RepID=A0A3N1XSB1_9FIRM|nr:cyclic lactone autoinducer peptide [Mobilisporobacter senegalensis]ROR29128.1 cyclic lactone autoinducer peptide [Mobilisporobacter senegalensis]
MNKLTQLGLQAVSKASLEIAVSSTSKCMIFMHQPKVSQSLKRQLEEKKNN